MSGVFLKLKNEIELLLNSYVISSTVLPDKITVAGIIKRIRSSELTVEEKLILTKNSLPDDGCLVSLAHTVFFYPDLDLIKDFYELLNDLKEGGIPRQQIAEDILFIKVNNKPCLPSALIRLPNANRIYDYLCVLKRLNIDAVDTDIFRDHLMDVCIDLSGKQYSLYEYILQSKNNSLLFALIQSNILNRTDYLPMKDNINGVLSILDKAVRGARNAKEKEEMVVTLIFALADEEDPFYIYFSQAVDEKKQAIFSRLNEWLTVLRVENQQLVTNSGAPASQSRWLSNLYNKALGLFHHHDSIKPDSAHPVGNFDLDAEYLKENEKTTPFHDML